jgi:hypothetical protein
VPQESGSQCRRTQGAIKKQGGARNLLASRTKVADTSGRPLTNLMDKQELETRQRADDPVVGAVSANQLMGPWIVATIQGVSVPLAVDTFCPENLISLKQLGGEIEPTLGNLTTFAS